MSISGSTNWPGTSHQTRQDDDAAWVGIPVLTNCRNDRIGDPIKTESSERQNVMVASRFPIEPIDLSSAQGDAVF